MLEPTARVPKRMVDFGKVVIFRGEPENGNRFSAASAEFLCAANCGNRFVERKDGPGEQANLLAGNDRHRPGRKPVEILLSSAVRPEAVVLLAQNLGHLTPSLRVNASFSRRSYQTRARGGMRIVTGDSFESGPEKRRKSSLSGEFPERKDIQIP